MSLTATMDERSCAWIDTNNKSPRDCTPLRWIQPSRTTQKTGTHSGPAVRRLLRDDDEEEEEEEEEEELSCRGVDARDGAL
ncbi:hypothetical protein Tdes44962_MAKER10159 [Teratosphaeria destructans]|uniref:Uncharacterized protein n=1 Tax=Teratosphaeria destructans TaxID=418781 RepID=A0A9W7SNM5_9PEZI|nr:hypothetical protein Tdes44962_MAKER10159 [Teratosphaeria destructans]